MIHHESNDRLRRWQEEVARDPGADAFVPLADLYRAQGRLDVALRVCWRGLERHPEHVEGHYLLGRIYRDSDEAERAYDEWDIALGLEPTHLPSRRAMGFLCLERGQMGEAETHLRKALEVEPDDPRLLRALARAESRGEAKTPTTAYWERTSHILEPAIETFVRDTRVRLVLVIDPSGRLVAQHGASHDLDIAAFASLAAGIQAAAGEVARMMGQSSFSQLYQGKGEHQIFLGEIRIPHGALLLLSVFGAESPVGLVRTIFRETAEALAAAEWPEPFEKSTAGSLESELARGVDRLRQTGGRRSSAHVR
jgi:tetratricopeptide (TPR) repeat protein